MLQAREYACILLLLASALLVADSYAQDRENAVEDQQIQRIGDIPVEPEVELDPKVPTGQEPDVRQTETEAERVARQQMERERTIRRLFAEAGKAMKEDRIDQPPGDCAWYYYRAVLDMDPENTEAQRGLIAVQDKMIDWAMEYARELDFESADRILEDASLVRENREAIDRAHEEIDSFRAEHAADLEVAAVKAMDAADFAGAERILIDLIALGDTYDTVNQLRLRMEEARIYGGFKPGQAIRDHFMNSAIWTPESVIVLAGSFMMGSSAFEDGRQDNEGPQHRVSFRRGFAIGKSEVTVEQFREFIDKSNYKTDAEKHGYSTVYDHFSGRLTRRDGVTWEHDYQGEKASEDHPVVHVSWNDAQAYVNWLTWGTGKRYRLPSEAEFEYVLRGGKSSPYWWGKGAPSRAVENLTGEKDTSPGRRRWEAYFEDYEDGYWGPAPVASFSPNPFGLHDIGGNVGEWVKDCWHDTYLRAPLDGSAWVNPGCRQRVVRGGYWASSPDQARSAFRLSAKPDQRDARIGFRIARDL
jgi:formylglycine-generating enzyme required for sulfatase activity